MGIEGEYNGPGSLLAELERITIERGFEQIGNGLDFVGRLREFCEVAAEKAAIELAL